MGQPAFQQTHKDGLKKRVFDFVEANQPCTCAEIAAHLGIKLNSSRAIVHQLRNLKKPRLFLSGYRRDEEHGRILYIRPLYSTTKPEIEPKRPPRLTGTQYNRRQRAKKKVFVNSVFALAVPVDSRRVSNRKRPDVAKTQQPAA